MTSSVRSVAQGSISAFPECAGAGDPAGDPAGERDVSFEYEIQPA
jgi:hypothetical protein